MPVKKSAAIALVQTILLGTLLIFHFSVSNTFLGRPVDSDFSKFYASARYFWEGEDIYTPVAYEAFGPLPDDYEPLRESLYPNLNLPVVTLLLSPLGLWGYRVAHVVWHALSLLCGLAAVALLACATTKRQGRMHRVFWLAILLLVYFPTVANTGLGQLSLFLLLLLSIVWLAARGDNDSLAGIALGIALSVKLFVGLLLLFFLVRRRWRLLLWCATTFLLGAGVSLLVLGVDPYQSYLHTLGSVTWYGSNWNASLLGFFTRMFGGAENVPLLNIPWLAYLLSYGLSALAIAALIWLAWPRTSEPPAATFDLGFGLCLALMILVSPLGWMYYFPILLIAVMAGWYASDRVVAWRHKLAFALAWLLSMIPFPLLPTAELNLPLAWFTSAGVFFYALLILVLVLGTMLYQLETGRTPWRVLSMKHRGERHPDHTSRKPLLALKWPVRGVDGRK